MRRNKMSLRLPSDLLDRAKRLAEAESISVAQFITAAIEEKVGLLEAGAFYRAREGRSGGGTGWQALGGRKGVSDCLGRSS